MHQPNTLTIHYRSVFTYYQCPQRQGILLPRSVSTYISLTITQYSPTTYFLLPWYLHHHNPLSKKKNYHLWLMITWYAFFLGTDYSFESKKKNRVFFNNLSFFTNTLFYVYNITVYAWIVVNFVQISRCFT